MKNIIASIVASIIVAVVVCAIALSGQHVATPSAGGNFNSVAEYLSGGAAFGLNGDLISNTNYGVITCTGTASIAAGQKSNFDCPVTNVKGMTRPGRDKFFVTLASTTPAGVYVTSAYASSTVDNSFRLVLGNASSSANTAILTGVQYYIVR